MCDDTLLIKYGGKVCSNIIKREQKDVDPPIPPGNKYILQYKIYIFVCGKRVSHTFTSCNIITGAIKLNYSTRLSSLVLRFCDKDIDLMEIKVSGLENDCIYNANERMVLRAHLSSILAEDLNDDTLYSKVIILNNMSIFFQLHVTHIYTYIYFFILFKDFDDR